MQLETPRVAASLITAAVLVAVSGSSPPRSTAHRRIVQTAVTRDGFVVLEHAPLPRATELSHDGVREPARHLPRLPVDARMIGLADGNLAVVYPLGKRVAVDRVAEGGELARLGEFGRDVVRLCDGVASNHRRFGVAWLETDGSVQFVHGPRTATVDGTTVRRVSWCGIASAGPRIALLWQERDAAFLTACDERTCSRPVRLAVTSGHTLEAFGCTGAACVVATRAPGGALDIAWVTAAGRVRWRHRLDDARDDELTIVGMDDRHIAIGNASRGAACVIAVDEAGTQRRLWEGMADAAPSLVWSRDRLLVARQLRGELDVDLVQP